MNVHPINIKKRAENLTSCNDIYVTLVLHQGSSSQNPLLLSGYEAIDNLAPDFNIPLGSKSAASYEHLQGTLIFFQFLN